MHSPQSFRFCLLFSLASMMTLAGGCGGESAGPPRATVTGKITLDGTPVLGGEIRFRPSQGAETSTLISSEGTYRIDRLTDGPVVGANKVFIEWFRPSGKVDEDGNPILEAVIPEKYNLSSTLSAEIKPGNNVHHFDLQSK